MEMGKAQEKITVVWKCFTWSLVELLKTKKDLQKVQECGSDSVQN